MRKTFYLKKQQLLDRCFHGFAAVSAFTLATIIFAIFIALCIGSIPAIKAFNWHFLFSSSWDPVNGQFGAWTAIYGTLVTSLIALLIGIPIAFGAAIIINQINFDPIKKTLRILIETLAAIPSIIFGMWGLFIFAPKIGESIYPWLNDHLGSLPILNIFLQGPPLGIGLLNAGIILALMIVPFITSVLCDIFQLVPNESKESAYSLGANHAEVMCNIIIPHAKVGAFAAVMLGLGRALGETMAVAFVIGNSHQATYSLLMPGTSITATLANEFTEAAGKLYTASLIELGLILFCITMLVVISSRYLLYRLQHRKIQA